MTDGVAGCRLCTKYKSMRDVEDRLLCTRRAGCAHIAAEMAPAEPAPAPAVPALAPVPPPATSVPGAHTARIEAIEERVTSIEVVLAGQDGTPAAYETLARRLLAAVRIVEQHEATIARMTDEIGRTVAASRQDREAADIVGRAIVELGDRLAAAGTRTTALTAALDWAVGMAEEAILVREAGDDPADTPDIIAMHRAGLEAARTALTLAQEDPS